MAVKFSNNGKTTLSAGITSSATSISVTDGSVFPTLGSGDFFYMTLEDGSGNNEIVSVTAVSTNTLTVTRAQEGTTARAFSSGDKAENRLTAAGLNSFVSDSGDTMTGDLSVTGTVTSDGLVISGGDQILLDTGDISTYGELEVAHLTSGAWIGVYEGSDSASNRLRFATSGSARLTIDNNGNVGIGTPTPDTLLEVRGADPILTIRDTNTSSASSNATLRLAESGASDTLDAYWDIKADGGQLQFIDNWNEGGGTGTRLVIDDSGQVGLNTTPSSALHIKQGGNTFDDGLRLERSGNTNRWDFVTGGDNNLYLGYNGSSRVVVADSAVTFDPTVVTINRGNSAGDILLLRAQNAQKHSFTNAGATISGSLIAGGSQITSSSATFQNNGFMRTGRIHLHEGDASPTTNDKELNNVSGVLKWDSYTVWHNGNDGSGSGLDADTLDGYQLDGSTSIGTRIFNNKGQTHGTVTNFNTAMTPGPNYIQANTNGPGSSSSDQWYGFMFGLGSDYGTTTGTSGHYAAQMYFKRNASSNANYLYMRSMENGSWASWLKVSAGYADNADTVDSLHASSFLRSDADDVTTGRLTVDNHLLVQNNNVSGQGDNNTHFNYQNNGTNYIRGTNTIVSSALAVYGDATFNAKYAAIGNDTAAVSNSGNWDARLNVSGQNHARIDVFNDYDDITMTMYSHNGHSAGRVGTTSNHTTEFMANGSVVSYVTTAGNLYATASMRAPIFYDSNDTSYYVNPASNTFVNSLAIAGNNFTTSANDGCLTLWGTASSTTSRISFRRHDSSGVNWGGHGDVGDTYATFFEMDTSNRGWVFRNATTASNVASISNNGRARFLNLGLNTNPRTDAYRLSMGGSIHMNNYEINYVQQLHFNDNVRFYDEGNDSYLNFKFGDASAGGIKMRNSAGELCGYLYGNSDQEFGFLDNDGHWAVKIRTGNDPLELRCNNNIEFKVQTSYAQALGSFRAPVFYDTDNTNYSINFASTSYPKYLGRREHNTGHLVGGHNNIGSTATQSCPIYTIGSSYNPSGTTLSNMYGVGYSHTNASFIGFAGSSGWGFYVAADGDARCYLSGQQGHAYFTGNVTAYASDQRLKTNVKTIENALDKVTRIRGVEFDWVDNISSEYDFHPQQMHETGVLAQEIQEVVPDAVVEAPMNANYTAKSGVENNFLTVDKEKIIPLLIEAIKELKAEVDALKGASNV